MVEEEEDEDEDKEEDEENIILVVMQGACGHGRAAPRHLVTLGHLEVWVPGSVWPWGNCRQKSPGTTAGPCRQHRTGGLWCCRAQGSRTGAGQRGGDGPCGLWVTVRGTEQPPHTTSAHHRQISEGLWREAMPAPGAPQPCSRSLAPRASQPCNLPYQHLGAAAAASAPCLRPAAV